MQEWQNNKNSKKSDNSGITKKIRNSDPAAFKKLFDLYSNDLLDFSY